MRAEALTKALGGRWHGGYGVAFCPAHDNRRTPALSLTDGENGRLLAYCFAGCDTLDVFDALRREGHGVDGFRPPLPPRPESDDNGGDKRAAALAIWAAALPIGGSIAERYLRGRAIASALPASLRHYPGLRHSGAQL